MQSCQALSRPLLLTVLVLLIVQGAAAWSFSGWSVSPPASEVAPETPVTAAYTLKFDSWMTGSTFDKDNSLVMSTDLKNPQWTVKKVEPMDDQPPIVEQIPVRQAGQVRLDGWTLSYSRKQFEVSVELAGTIPSPEKSGPVTLVKLQEMKPGAQPTGTTLKKEVQVRVPTPIPTLMPETTAGPTLNMTPAEYIEVTPEIIVPAGPVPEKKATYSPGPGPLCLAGVLALIVFFAGRHRD